MSELASLLADRKNHHGDFSNQATIAQALKRQIGDNPLSDIQREAIEMILHKVARIIAGDPNHIDHWVDISGYAQLVVDRMPKAPAKDDRKAKP